MASLHAICEFVSLVKEPRNFRNIVNHKLKIEKEGLDVSQFFDYCIDEEAVDALVVLGGNPSVTKGDFFSGVGPPFRGTRNITRRLYHGASGLNEKDLKMAKRWTVILLPFGISKRRSYYLGVDKKKLEFWLKYKPSLFSEEETQSTPVLGGNAVAGDGPNMIHYRPVVELRTGNTLITRIYTTRHMSVSDWVDAERAFGRYHRTANILVSCIRSEKKYRIQKKAKTQSMELKCFMYRLPLGVAKNVIGFL